ncbi:hypothetical protein AURDEDRAFT_29644, partial [Auricularia subglabra TFB-10046 SS5]
TTFELDLPRELKQRGIHNAFHVSLLRPHVTNDDARFPDRHLGQLPGFKDVPEDWFVTEITCHSGRGRELLFEVTWNTGQVTWERLRKVKHLAALESYLKAMGVDKPRDLPAGRPTRRTRVGMPNRKFYGPH